MRDSRHKLEHVRFRLDIRKTFFITRIDSLDFVV